MITAINNKIPEIKEKDLLTEKIIACAYKVYSEIGPGFNEKIYHKALNIALEEAKLSYNNEKQYKVFYCGKQVGFLKIDLLVENKVIVEIKAIAGDMPKVFEAQLLSYLKVAKINVGLLINFGNKSCWIRRLML